MGTFMTLLEREIRNALGWRLLIVLALMGGCELLIAVSASSSHRLNMHAVAFFMWILGFLVAGAMTFDRIAGEREHRTLDFVLGFGVTKTAVAVGKICGAVVIALILAIGYVGANAVSWAIFVPPGELVALAGLLGPAWLMFLAYALIAEACSVVARSSKIAMVVFVVVGMALRPRLWLGVADGLSHTLGLTEGMHRIIVLVCPELSFSLLGRIGGLPGGQLGAPTEALLCQAGLLAACTVTLLWVFRRQEEMAYGE